MSNGQYPYGCYILNPLENSFYKCILFKRCFIDDVLILFSEESALQDFFEW